MKSSRRTRLTDARLSLSNVLVLLAVVSAASFAAGRAMPDGSSTARAEAAPESVPVGGEAPGEDTAREGAEFQSGSQELPPGHPAIDPGDPGGGGASAESDDLPIRWVVPTRWEQVPNTSSMRLATYRVPRAAGDPGDADFSITRAGGSAEANADRWVNQFDQTDRSSARRTTRRVGPLEVLLVEVEGTYSGGMGKESEPAHGWALLGAIIEVGDRPLFFKLVGPAKTVRAAKAEFDAMVGTLAPK